MRSGPSWSMSMAKGKNFLQTPTEGLTGGPLIRSIVFGFLVLGLFVLLVVPTKEAET